MTRTHLLIGASAVAIAAVFFLTRPAPVDDTVPPAPAQGGDMVAIQMPRIDGNAAIGQRIFETSCAACHGQNAVGVEGAGPPLIHIIYEPSHHGDESFQRAVANGVRAHHWGFGNMPPVDGLTRGDVKMIITFIRDIQRANGIQ